MRPLFFVLFLMICSTTLFCCKSKLVNKADLSTYLDNPANGTIKKEKVRGMDIQVKYLPAELLIAQELGRKLSTTRSVDSLRQKYQQSVYFILSLAKDNKEILSQTGDFSTYSNLLQTIAFHLDKFIFIKTATGRTVPVSNYSFLPSYGMAASNQVLLSFSADELRNANWLEFNLKEFGLNSGSLKFIFKKADIETVPALLLSYK